MEQLNVLQTEMKIHFSQSLQYGHRKMRNRLELRLSTKLFNKLQNRFAIGGHFKQYDLLAKHLKVPTQQVYPDGYTVDLLQVHFRVVKYKSHNFNGVELNSIPKLIVRYTRSVNK